MGLQKEKAVFPYFYKNGGWFCLLLFTQHSSYHFRLWNTATPQLSHYIILQHHLLKEYHTRHYLVLYSLEIYK
jgi:hypothetical protein